MFKTRRQMRAKEAEIFMLRAENDVLREAAQKRLSTKIGREVTIDGVEKVLVCWGVDSTGRVTMEYIDKTRYVLRQIPIAT